MNLSKLSGGFQRLGRWLREKYLHPALRRSAGYLLKITEPRCQDPPSANEWKQKALSDFSRWLEDIPEDGPLDERVEMDGCDLYTMLTEFAALRQEIKLQTREQHKTLKIQEALIDGHRQIVDLYKDRIDKIDRLEESIRRSTEKKTVLPFLEIRDALVRGLAAARTACVSEGLFRRPPKGIEGVVEGYELALRRFDRALALIDVRPILAVGRPFDPVSMLAVDRRKIPDRAPGIVLEEYVCGFIRGNELIRAAEVVVNAG
jgi:molecular chaperone GrpE (heat shock protein)